MMGGVTTIIPQPHALMFGLKHPPSLLTTPWPIPTEFFTPPGSHFPPNPLDGGGPGRDDFEHWEMAEGSEWIEGESKCDFYLSSFHVLSVAESSSIASEIIVSRVQSLPTLHALRTAEGKVFAMYKTQQLAQFSNVSVSRWDEQLTPVSFQPVYSPIPSIALPSSTSPSVFRDLFLSNIQGEGPKVLWRPTPSSSRCKGRYTRGWNRGARLCRSGQYR